MPRTLQVVFHSPEAPTATFIAGDADSILFEADNGGTIVITDSLDRTVAVAVGVREFRNLEHQTRTALGPKEDK